MRARERRGYEDTGGCHTCGCACARECLAGARTRVWECRWGGTRERRWWWCLFLCGVRVGAGMCVGGYVFACVCGCLSGCECLCECVGSVVACVRVCVPARVCGERVCA